MASGSVALHAKTWWCAGLGSRVFGCGSECGGVIDERCYWIFGRVGYESASKSVSGR